MAVRVQLRFLHEKHREEWNQSIQLWKESASPWHAYWRIFKKNDQRKREKNNRQFHSICWTHVETLPEQEEYGSWLYLAAFDGNQKCNPASIDFTFVIQKLFSQLFYFFSPLSSLWSTCPHYPSSHSYVKVWAQISRWKLSEWERSFQPKASVSLHAKPGGWVRRLAMNATVAGSPLNLHRTRGGGDLCLHNIKHALHF